MKALLSGLLLSAVLSPYAAAHLMVAQRGTLNVVGDGVFMVLSLSVSAFAGVDDDGDGKLSSAEFSKHRTIIGQAVSEQVRLSDADGPRPLVGMMLSPVIAHDVADAPAEQLVVMGRFVLADVAAELKFRVGLFGRQAEEQTLAMSAKRAAEPKKQLFELTPEQSEVSLFPEDAD